MRAHLLQKTTMMRLRTLVTIIGVTVACGVSIRAQQRTYVQSARAAGSMAVRLLPDFERLPLTTLPPGTQVKVIRREGDWVHIQFRDERYGDRSGYVLAAGLVFDSGPAPIVENVNGSPVELKDGLPIWSETIIVYESPSEEEIAGAIDLGQRARGSPQGLSLTDAPEPSYPTMGTLWKAAAPGTRLRVQLFTTLAWIRQMASDASRSSRSYSVADVSAETLEPVLRVVACPDTTDLAMRGLPGTAAAVQHVVLRDEVWRIVVQPLFAERVAANASGDEIVLDGLRAKFPLEALRDLRGPRGDRDFFVTVTMSTGEDKSYRITKDQFEVLP